MSQSVDAIILAAGKGTRMGSDKPKVLFSVAGRPMVWWVVKACVDAGVDRCIIVVGFHDDQVRKALVDLNQCHFVEQTEQRGTGHATQMAEPLFGDGQVRSVFVLGGDGPLIRSQTLEKLLAVHRQKAASATLATAILDDPQGYGRVIRKGDGQFQTIVEHKDATPEQLQIREVNPSYYCFQSRALFAALTKVQPHNLQGEYYLTDVPALLRASGQKVALVDAVAAEDVLSINTPQQLAHVDTIMHRRMKEQPVRPGQPA